MMNKTLATILMLLLGLFVSGCVAPDLLPVASFTLSPSSGLSPLTVTLDASRSQSPNGVIVNYVWNFGDGSTGTGMIVAHSYQAEEERSFTVTLQIIDHEGNSASSSAEVTVQAPVADAEKPSIEFVWPFHFDAEGDDAANLNDEYFTLQNTGNVTVDLSGWRVENGIGTSFRFPNGVSLAPGAMITIHSGNGVNTWNRLYWNASEPVWNNDSDLAFLLDAAGQIVIHYPITTC